MSINIEISLKDGKYKDPMRMVDILRKSGLGQIEKLTIKQGYTTLVEIRMDRYSEEEAEKEEAV